jgi:hypothetical protein
MSGYHTYRIDDDVYSEQRVRIVARTRKLFPHYIEDQHDLHRMPTGRFVKTFSFGQSIWVGLILIALNGFAG